MEPLLMKIRGLLMIGIEFNDLVLNINSETPPIIPDQHRRTRRIRQLAPNHGRGADPADEAPKPSELNKITSECTSVFVKVFYLDMPITLWSTRKSFAT
jgi:hypothetical protein